MIQVLSSYRTASVVLIVGLPSSLGVEDELVVWLDPYVLVRVPSATHVWQRAQEYHGVQQ